MNGDAEASIKRAKEKIQDANKAKGKTRKPDNKPGFKGKRIRASGQKFSSK